MKLEDFIKDELIAVNDFNAYWQLQNKKNPEQYPLYLNWGDWNEQFELWKRILI